MPARLLPRLCAATYSTKRRSGGVGDVNSPPLPARRKERKQLEAAAYVSISAMGAAAAFFSWASQHALGGFPSIGPYRGGKNAEGNDELTPPIPEI
jgi:hypothetical protein